MRRHIETALSVWGLPADAVRFVGTLWDAIQAIDDIKDGTALANVDDAIRTLIVDLPCDPFLGRHRASLAPVLVTAYLKWQAANDAEASRAPGELDKAYVWRASFYDVVMLVVALCLPEPDARRLAPAVMALYGETREDYLKEFAPYA